jgi:hypothetical protein
LQAIAFSLREIEHGEDKDPAMWVLLGNILDHLCLAWHRRRLGPDEVLQENQEDYERKAVSVPNWGEQFQLVEFTALHPSIEQLVSHRIIDRKTVGKYLRDGEAALQNLMGKIETGQLDACDTTTLADYFKPILYKLCLAWHLRFLSSADVSSLDPKVINDLGFWMPPWQWNLHLVPVVE